MAGTNSEGTKPAAGSDQKDLQLCGMQCPEPKEMRHLRFVRASANEGDWSPLVCYLECPSRKRVFKGLPGDAPRACTPPWTALSDKDYSPLGTPWNTRQPVP